MASLSPTDVAFEGFRLTRERPRAIIAWAACYLAFTVAMFVGAELTLGPQWQALVLGAQRAANDPVAMQAYSQKLSPFAAVALPVLLLLQSVLTCAIYRAVLRPGEARGGYLRLGADELRMLVLNLVLDLLWLGVLTAVSLVTTLAADAAATSAGSPAVLLGAAATAGSIGLGVTVMVRLSLAGPMTFAERRLRIFESWALTRGVFWRLFWAYLLALVLAFAVFLLMLMLVYGILGAIALGAGLAPQSIDFASPNPLAVGLAIVSEIASVVMLTCFFVLWYAPPAQAYKDLARGRVTA
ncbi:MAG TPA: hypothetical protein VKT30_13670 [Caulobacteraceae bacterium]|nr:hypothetical protein [Caulobacteraceae bacterium]